MESLTVMMIMTMLTMRMRMTMRASLVSFELHLSSGLWLKSPSYSSWAFHGVVILHLGI